MRLLLLPIALLGCSDVVPERDLPMADARPPLFGEDAGLVAPPEAGPEDPRMQLEPEQRAFFLRLHDDAPPPLELKLDRAGVEELFGPIADDIELLELDALPLLDAALERIRNACGGDWRRDDHNPRLDCSLTEEGREFAPGGPEQRLVRLLTMTPANADVEDTSVEFIQDIANLLNIGGGFPQVLAEALQIQRTDPLLSREALLEALREDYLGTHPEVVGGRYIPVSLRDVLEDLQPLTQRFGPSGAHPGLFAPGFDVFSEVFGPDFEMRIEAESNLRVLDGLYLRMGNDSLVRKEGAGPLDLRFIDRGAFEITGLNPDLTMDLRVGLFEHPSYVPACAGDDRCMQNGPNNPVGQGTVWTLDPWAVERLIGTAGRIEFADLRTFRCYDDCDFARISIGQNGTPAGWADFDVPFNLGPRDQFVWELIGEMLQQGLHGNGRVPEGQANLEFTLREVPVGLSAEEAEDIIRPFLQGQALDLANFLLGDFRRHSGHVDLYYARTTSGVPALWFIHPDDLDPEREYTWARPGFYADPQLTQKVSTTVLDGSEDQVREKWPVVRGTTTLYAQDAEGMVHTLNISVDDPREILIELK